MGLKKECKVGNGNFLFIFIVYLFVENFLVKLF